MLALSIYLPMDRRFALARGETLPDRTSGAALFADISGFTPLAEGLARTLGARRGAEELARELNLVYNSLIATVDRFGGSVVNFSGDAITCWFDDNSSPGEHPSLGPAGQRAAACALLMQGVFAAFGAVTLPSGGIVTLAIKVAIACGPARRFVVGDPAIQCIDVLAGTTLERMAAAAQVAHRAEVLLSPECLPALSDEALIVEWRSGTAGEPEGTRYPVIGGMLAPVPDTPWPPLAHYAIPDEQLRSWVLPVVYSAFQADRGELLPELRQALALFLRFSGIDYDGDDTAGAKLDQFIRWVQHQLAHYNGTLIQLTMGDKGSFLEAAFGAPVAHEDDARRAALAALALRSLPAELAFIDSVQIGISQGTMWAGAYGGTTCRTYGLCGDNVNLAARLMSHAAPGEVLTGGRMQQQAGGEFAWEELSPISVKGKRDPVPVARLVGTRLTATTQKYTGPLVGRTTELAQLRDVVQPIFERQFGGVVAIYGEMGIGKSHLVDELRRQLTRDYSLLWLTCPADGILQPSLHPFRACLQAYFNQSADRSQTENNARFDTILDALLADLPCPEADDVRNELTQARSFLGALLDLRWVGSPYEQVEPHLRFERSVVAFRSLIRAESQRQPVVLHLEDTHWLDVDSQVLVEVLVREAEAYPFAVVLTSRVGDDGMPLAMPQDAGIPRHVLQLDVLSPDAVRVLAAQALDDTISDDLLTFLVEKTDGNPLFVEHLALDLHERGALARSDGGMLRLVSNAVAEVPASVTAAVVARLDRLAPLLKGLVQTAAVLGHSFDVRVLARMRTEDPKLATQMADVEAEGIWSATEKGYRFRHALLRDAAYEMQVRVRLRKLHAEAGAALEDVYGAALAGHVAELAYHYRQAGDVERERHYLALVGEQAFNVSAFRDAIAAFERVLALTPAPQRGRLTTQLARSYLLLRDSETAQRLYEESLALTEAAGDHAGRAAASYELGLMAFRRQAYGAALDYLQRSLELYRTAHDRAGEGRTLNYLGGLYIELGETEKALVCYEEAMGLPRQSEGGQS